MQGSFVGLCIETHTYIHWVVLGGNKRVFPRASHELHALDTRNTRHPTHANMYVCTYIYICTCEHTYIYIYIYIYVYIYVYIYIHLYIYTYIHITDTHTPMHTLSSGRALLNPSLVSIFCSGGAHRWRNWPHARGQDPDALRASHVWRNVLSDGWDLYHIYIYLYIYIHLYLDMCQYLYISIYLLSIHIYISISISIYLSIHLSVCLSIYPSIHLSIHTYIHTYIDIWSRSWRFTSQPCSEKCHFWRVRPIPHLYIYPYVYLDISRCT